MTHDVYALIWAAPLRVVALQRSRVASDGM